LPWIFWNLSESRQGNTYLLIVSDYFTRWVEAYPLPNSEAITVVQVFIEECISRYGIPRHIHTDRGSQFTFLFFKNTVYGRFFGLTKPKQRSDGLVERFNRTNEDMLSKAVSDLSYAIQLSKPKIVHHDRLKAYLREPKT
jgi:hypothetical protein